MKKNSQNATKHCVAIATTSFKTIAIAIAMLVAFAKANATNINATFTAPTKFGGCIDSVFTLNYNSLGDHTIKISANLDNGAEDNCSSANFYQIIIDSVSVNGATLNYIDFTNATFKCTVTGTPNVTIKWHVRVDCSILSLNNFLQSVNLIQHFKDTTNNYAFKINGGSDSSLTSVIVPRIFSNQTSTPTFYTSYLTQRFFEYTFLNFTDVDFKMKFKFHVNDTTICSQATTDSFAYSTSAFGPFTKFAMDNLVSVNLPHDSDLFIRQYVKGLACMPSKCAGLATFQWQCAFSDTVESYFCSSCGKTDTINFEVDSNEICVIKIENLTPNNYNNDFSCFNSFQSWSYRLTQDSISTSASDSMFTYIQHYGGGNSINNLTLIPSNSISFDCKNCTATAKIINAPYPQHLCQNYIDSSLTQLEIKVYNFEIGDTLFVNFKTFRCAEENDSVLLNKPKNFNNWIFGANSYNVCGKLFGSAVSLSRDNFIGYANNIDQQIQFFPTFNNIVVPHGQTVSDTNYLSFIMDKLDKRSDYYSNQYLGWSADSAEFPTKAKGIIRARITVDEGLHVLPDNLVYFKLDTGGTVRKIYPDYYYHTSTDCNPDTLYFYFHLSDTIYYILNFGTFETNVEACCPNDNTPQKKYTVDFHIMPFPNSSCISNSNFYPDTTHTLPPSYSTLASFIPMSGKTHIIYIRCPGCLQPGSIVDSYKLKRISWGLTDSNNNGFADFPQTQINPDSAWFASNKNKIAELNSSYGDRLAEFTVAHFQDGDYTNNGYEYYQMKASGAILNYLQYSVTLQMQNALDSAISDSLMQQQLGLTPDSLWFFIDEKNTGSPYCLDCKPFETDTFFRTTLKIVVGANDLSKFMTFDSVKANWFYTFSFVPTDSNSVVGSSNPFNKYYDASLFHDSLQAWQRYRIAVFYKECKHFDAPPNSASLTVEDVMKRRKVNTMMWFAGANYGSNAFSNTPTAPENYSELNLHGWKAYNDLTTSLTNMNQQFADSFIFYCEMNGGLHYFFAQDLTFTATYYKDDYSCGMNMTATAESRTAGRIYDPYPYEYHPPLLYLNQLSFQKPNGFNATLGTSTNFIYVPYGNGAITTPFAHYILPSPDVNNFITLNTQSIAPPVCLDESHYNNIPSTDTSAYVKDGYTASVWTVNYQPENCFANYVVNADTAIFGLYGNINLSCIISAGCTAGDSLKGYNGQRNLTSRANLQTTIIPSSNGAISNEMCWHVDLTNPDKIIDSVFIALIPYYFHTSAAAHIYMVPPSVGFLNNWTFTPDNNLSLVIPIPNDSIFHWAAYLAVGGSLSGTFCAEYFPCIGANDTDVTFIVGYDCNHFPVVPFGSDTNCTTYIMTDKQMHDVQTLSPSSNSNPVTFSICYPTEKIVDYTTQTLPYIYPDSVVLYNMPTQVIIDSVFFSLCSDASTLHKLTNAVLPNHWLINHDTLDSIGYTDGALTITSNFDCIRIHLFLHQECDFFNGTTSDSLVLYSHNHCDTIYPSAYNNTTFIWDSTSHCNDCFAVAKTANTDSILVGDTITYTITACANNQFQQQIVVTDTLPPNFFVTSTQLPYSGWIGADTCLTFIVSGYFTSSDFDSCYNNVAWLKDSANNLWHDDTCIKVMPTCYTAGMIILPDSTLSSSLSSTTNKIYYIDSTLIINSNITFTNCTLYVATGGSIVVLPGDTITLDSSSVEGCGYMWQGLKIDTTAFINSYHSRVRDANIGIEMKSSGGFYVDSSQVIDCVKGIYVPQRSCGVLNTTIGAVQGTTFGLERAAFLPDYSGQPAHGVLPKVGVDFSDMVITFGSDYDKRNYFHNMNMGIIGYRSDINLKNSIFRNISIDTNYTEDYGGTAIVSLGQLTNCHVAGSIEIQGVPNDDTLAKNIYRGIYTRYSDLLVANNKIINSTVGIYSNNTSEGLKANVYGCYIEAKNRGINWYGNAGAYYMAAENDTIVMSGDSLGVGIKLTETTNVTANHKILFNVITLTETKDGINATATLKPIITGNKVYQLSSGIYYPTTRGIYVDGCDTAVISCNTVTTNYPDTLPSSFGLRTSDSKSFDMQCNQVDGHYRGIWFGGNCALSDSNFKGNSMNNNFEGLYLNSTAVIGIQTRRGNLWSNYSGSKGAKCANTLGYASSLFRVNNNGTEKPTFTPTNWFVILSGSIFTCDSYCTNLLSRENNDKSYQQMVAAGSSLTSDLIPENKNIAKQGLFEELSADNTLRNSDTLFTNFYNDNENGAIGKVFQAKENINEAKKIAPYDFYLIVLADSLIKIKKDSIELIDKNVSPYSPTNYSAIRNNLISSLNILLQTKANILLQNDIKVEANLDSANAIASSIIPTELPEENWKFIQQMQVLYEKHGKDGLINYYSQFLCIAQQCPFAGGRAVAIARNFVELFSERIVYDDDLTCLQNGIFKEFQQTVTNETEIILIPNPANDFIEVQFDKETNLSDYDLQIMNSLGELVLQKNLNEKTTKKINVSSLTNGVYIIQIKKSNSIKFNSKLIIVR